MRVSLSLALLCLAAAPAWAQMPFQFPLNCTLGETCTVLRYQDTREAPGDMADPLCGTRTTDNQIGTFFAIANLKAMNDGILVKAVADGDVELAQDGAPDRPGGDCGNGLRIRHKGGWMSTYCGLRRGSVAMRENTHVKAGQALGLAGFSGQLPAPGLAFTLERYGRPYDVWSGKPVTAGCGAFNPLMTGLRYEPVGVVQSGLNYQPPSSSALLKGLAPLDAIPPNAPVVLWLQVTGAQPGDKVSFSLSQNGKTIWESGGALGPNQPLPYARKTAPKNGWALGPLNGKIAIMRKGQIVAERMHGVMVVKPATR